MTMCCSTLVRVLGSVAVAAAIECSFDVPLCYKPAPGAVDGCCDNEGNMFGGDIGGICLPSCSVAYPADCKKAETYGSRETPYCDPMAEGNPGLCLVECKQDKDCFPNAPHGKGICKLDWTGKHGLCMFPWDLIESVIGKWVAIGDSGGAVTWSLSVTHGVSHSHTDTNTTEWGQKVGVSVTAGFDFMEKFEVTVSGEISHQFSATHSDTFLESTTTTITHNFDSAGTAWQFVMYVHEIGGISEVYLNSFALTQGQFDPPCCLPGYWMDPGKPTGACHPDSKGNVFNVCHGKPIVDDGTNVTLV